MSSIRHPLEQCAHALALGLSVTCSFPTAVAQGPTFGVPAAGGGPPLRIDTSMAFDAARGRTVVFGDPFGPADTWEWDGIAWVKRTPATVPGNLHGNPAPFELAYVPGLGSVLAQGTSPTWVWDGVDWHPHNGPWTSMDAGGVAYHGGANPGVLQCGPGNTSSSFCETWLFDGAAWSLRSASGPARRSCPAAGYSPFTVSTYLLGGLGWTPALGPTPKNEMWRWNGTSWSLVNNLGTPPWPLGIGHAMAWDEDRGAFVVVGEFATHFATPLAESPNDVIWTSVPHPSPLFDHLSSCAFDSVRRRVVHYAGNRSGTTTLFRELPQGTNNWIDLGTPSPTPSARCYVDMACDPFAGTMLFGGWNGSQPLADTWSFDGNRWHNRGTSALAQPRIATALCRFDGLGGTVMFGGGTFTGHYFNDTRLWDGYDWHSLQPWLGPSPSGRMCHDMVYDSANARVVMFGGSNGASLGDTWVLTAPWWSGLQWTQIGWSGFYSPLRRNSHRMAYDENRQRVVMFGGSGANGQFLGDTWELVGDTWQQVFPAQSPSPRWQHVMDYDPLRGVVVLIGGYSSGTFLNDVWEYDGVTWTQRTPKSTVPSGREGAGLIWDPTVQRFVIRGGYSWSTGLCADTWFYNGQ